MQIQEIFAIRRRALHRLIQQYDSTAEFCRQHHQDDSRIRHLLNGQRNFAEKAARQLEEDCKLPDFYFDADIASAMDLIATFNQLKPEDRQTVLRIARQWSRDDSSAEPE